MIRSFITYYFAPTKNWRALRRLCMARLPEKEQKAAAQS